MWRLCEEQRDGQLVEIMSTALSSQGPRGQSGADALGSGVRLQVRDCSNGPRSRCLRKNVCVWNVALTVPD